MVDSMSPIELGSWVWRFITLLFISSSFWCGVDARAAVPNCAHLLSLNDYREGNQIVLDPGVSVLSRKPEAGSLEDRKPGVAKAIVAVMNGRMPFFRWPHARAMTDVDAAEIVAEFQRVRDDLDSVPAQFKLDPSDRDRFESMSEIIQDQIQSVTQNYSSFSLTSDKINSFTVLAARIQASLFELFVSTYIDGEKFWFHQDALKFYRGQRMTPSGRLRTHRGEHEIDIVVRRRDGKELWIEVKNNAMEWTLEDYATWAQTLPSRLSENAREFHQSYERSRTYGMNGSILDQVKNQLRTRENLGKIAAVDLMLVSKFPISAEQHVALTDLGIQTWPIYFSAQAFLPQYFQAISKQIE